MEEPRGVADRAMFPAGGVLFNARGEGGKGKDHVEEPTHRLFALLTVAGWTGLLGSVFFITTLTKRNWPGLSSNSGLTYGLNPIPPILKRKGPGEKVTVAKKLEPLSGDATGPPSAGNAWNSVTGSPYFVDDNSSQRGRLRNRQNKTFQDLPQV